MKLCIFRRADGYCIWHKGACKDVIEVCSSCETCCKCALCVELKMVKDLKRGKNDES